MITRQVIIVHVWLSKGIYVEDGSLMQTISICRKALEDKTGMIIVTERGKGYRFAGQVTQDKERALQKIKRRQESEEAEQQTASSNEENTKAETAPPIDKKNNLLTLIALLSLIHI